VRHVPGARVLEHLGDQVGVGHRGPLHGDAGVVGFELLVVPVERRVTAAGGEVVELGDGDLGVAVPAAAAAAARRGAARGGQGQHGAGRGDRPGSVSGRPYYFWRAHDFLQGIFGAGGLTLD